MGHTPRTSTSDSFLAGAAVGVVALLALAFAGLSSLPLLSDGRANFLALGLPGFLAGWIAPKGRRLVAALPVAALLALQAALHSGYLAPFAIPLLIVVTLLCAMLGGLLARFVPLRPCTAVVSTLLVSAFVLAYLGFQDRVFLILTQSRPTEWGGHEDGLLFIPGPASRGQALIAIGERLAKAGKPEEAQARFDEAKLNVPHAFLGGLPLSEAIISAEIRAGFYDRAETDAAALPTDRDSRLKFLANEYLRVGNLVRVRAIASSLEPTDRFALLERVAEADAKAGRIDAARATLRRLLPLAEASNERDRAARYGVIGQSLIRYGFEDEGLGILLLHTPEELPGVARGAADAGLTSLAARTAELAADAGISLEPSGARRQPAPVKGQ